MSMRTFTFLPFLFHIPITLMSGNRHSFPNYWQIDWQWLPSHFSALTIQVEYISPQRNADSTDLTWFRTWHLPPPTHGWHGRTGFEVTKTWDERSVIHLASSKSYHHFKCFLNSSPPSATYMNQWTGSALVQVMAWRLFGAKPLPEPMLTYCQLYPREQISVKVELEFYHFHSGKCIWKCCLPEWRPFCPGGDELAPEISSAIVVNVVWAAKTYSWYRD